MWRVSASVSPGRLPPEVAVSSHDPKLLKLLKALGIPSHCVEFKLVAKVQAVFMAGAVIALVVIVYGVLIGMFAAGLCLMGADYGNSVAYHAGLVLVAVPILCICWLIAWAVEHS